MDPLAGPTTTKTKGEFAIDYEDIAVRGMMVMDQGELTWPWTPPALPPLPPKLLPRRFPSSRRPTTSRCTRRRRSVCATPVGAIGLGMLAPNPAFTTMMSTFALSGVIGYQVVWGVAHSCTRR